MHSEQSLLTASPTLEVTGKCTLNLNLGMWEVDSHKNWIFILTSFQSMGGVRWNIALPSEEPRSVLFAVLDAEAFEVRNHGVGFLGKHRYTMIYLGLSPPSNSNSCTWRLKKRDPLLEIQWSLWWLESWAGGQPKIDYNAYIDDSLQPAAPKYRAARNIKKYSGPSTKTNRIINNTPTATFGQKKPRHLK